MQGVPVTFLPRTLPLRLDPWTAYAAARVGLHRWIHARTPDLVVGFGTETGFGYAAVTGPAPALISLQGLVAAFGRYLPVSRTTRCLLARHERVALRQAAGVHVETGWARARVRELAPGIPVTEIPHAVNPEFFHLVPAATGPDFVFIGSLLPHKHPAMAIRALAAMPSRNATLTLIGGGPETEACRHLASTLGVADRVRLTGPLDREAVTAELARARGLLVCSFADTAPNVITEAQAAGVPVIATAVSGIPDMITPGEDGVLVGKDDHPAMAEAMQEFATNPDRACAMGRQGRDRAWRDHAPEHIAGRHAALYRDTLDRLHRTEPRRTG